MNLIVLETDQIMQKILKEYVTDNGLDITAYQDYGWEPVKLSETENWDMKKELTW